MGNEDKLSIIFSTRPDKEEPAKKNRIVGEDSLNPQFDRRVFFRRFGEAVLGLGVGAYLAYINRFKYLLGGPSILDYDLDGVDVNAQHGTEPQKEEEKETVVDLLYPWSNKSEEVGIREYVEKEKTVWGANINTEVIKSVVGIEDLIRQSARDYGMPEELLIGLVITESLGNPNAESLKELPWEERARGLTQMMKFLAEKNGLKVSPGEEDERFDPKKILPVTAKLLRQYYENHGNWGDAFEEWHMGLPNLFYLKRIALGSFGVRVENRQIRTLSEQNKLDSYNMYRVTEIQKIIFNPDPKKNKWDHPEIFLPRILAAIEKFNSIKNQG